MNMASGSLQRLEALRKNGFGSWGVYGSEGNYEIRGVMMWKGKEIAPEWKDHPSYSYHIFLKLNPHSEDDQKLILDYWLSR
jgi:elongation factor 1-gamma